MSFPDPILKDYVIAGVVTCVINIPYFKYSSSLIFHILIFFVINIPYNINQIWRKAFLFKGNEVIIFFLEESRLFK